MKTTTRYIQHFHSAVFVMAIGMSVAGLAACGIVTDDQAGVTIIGNTGKISGVLEVADSSAALGLRRSVGGQIAGIPYEGKAWVQLLDAGAGRVLALDTIDSAGLFRFDSLAAGEYLLRAVTDLGTAWPVKNIVLEAGEWEQVVLELGAGAVSSKLYDTVDVTFEATIQRMTGGGSVACNRIANYDYVSWIGENDSIRAYFSFDHSFCEDRNEELARSSFQYQWLQIRLPGMDTDSSRQEIYGFAWGWDSTQVGVTNTFGGFRRDTIWGTIGLEVPVITEMRRENIATYVCPADAECYRYIQIPVFRYYRVHYRLFLAPWSELGPDSSFALGYIEHLTLVGSPQPALPDSLGLPELLHDGSTWAGAVFQGCETGDSVRGLRLDGMDQVRGLFGDSAAQVLEQSPYAVVAGVGCGLGTADDVRMAGVWVTSDAYHVVLDWVRNTDGSCPAIGQGAPNRWVAAPIPRDSLPVTFHIRRKERVCEPL